MTITCPSCQQLVPPSAFYPIVLDNVIHWRSRSTVITKTEAQLLRLLPFGGEFVDGAKLRDELFTNMEGNSLSVHVCRLRPRLREIGLQITTRRNVGYGLTVA